MANSDSVATLKKFVANLPEAQQVEFRERFNKADAEEKEKVIQNVVAKFSARPSSPNVAQRTFGNASPVERLQTGAISGIPSAVAGVKPKDAWEGNKSMLPIAGQVLGARFGGFPGAVGGATAGEALKEHIGYIDGTRQPNPKDAISSLQNILTTTGGTALGEGAFRLPGKMFFGKQIGAKSKQIVGEKLGELAKTISQSRVGKTATVSSEAVIKKIDDILASSGFERGTLRSSLVKIKNKISGLKRDLTFDETRNLEQQLGREAKFASEASQGHFVTQPKAPTMNRGAQGLRTDISNQVDDIATKAGHPEYKKLSKEYSELASKYPEKDLHKGMSLSNMLGNFLMVGGGGAYGIAKDSVPAMVVSVLGLLNSIPQKVRTQMFRALIDKPLTQAATGVGRVATSKALSEGGKLMMGGTNG